MMLGLGLAVGRGVLVACAGALLLLAADAALADAGEPLRIGILSFRDRDVTREKWEPLARYLEERVPGQRFEIRGLYLDEMTQAVERGDVELALTHPEHFVHLRRLRGDLSAVATLVNGSGQYALPRLGGVILRRAERTDIAELGDLRGKRIASANRIALGGFHLQQKALQMAGVDIDKEAAEIIITGPPQDKVIDLLLQGKADAAFVRTGLVEALIAEGKLDPKALEVVNPRREAGFPMRLSTMLVPEWAMLADRARVPDAVVKAVSIALFQLRPDDRAAKSAGIHSFSPPVDYSRIEEVMWELHAHPDVLDVFNFRDVARKYSPQIASLLTALTVLLLVGLGVLIRSRRQVGIMLRERTSLLDSLGEGIYGVSSDGKCSFINPKALEILGWEHDEVIGRDAHDLFHCCHRDGKGYPASACPINQTLIDGQRRQGEEWFIRQNGEGFPAAFLATRAGGSAQRDSVVVIFRDITEERRAEESQRIAAIAFEAQEGMVVADAANRILRVNQAFTSVTGYTAEEAVGQTLSLLKSGLHDDAFYQAMWADLLQKGHWKGEIYNRRKSGEIYSEWLSISAVRDKDGKTTHFVASFVDTTQRKEAEEQIQFLAQYDSLTLLLNRRQFNDRLQKVLIDNKRRKRHSALLFIDLDDFRVFNDTMGHAAGDALLVQVAQRLLLSVYSQDSVARLGGDEFVVLLEDLDPDIHNAINRIRQIGERILGVFAEPFQLGEITHHCTASIGIVPFDGDESVEDLLKSADMAMYKAKDAGKNAMRFFDPTMQTEIEQHAMIERELRQALSEGQFTLFLQGQVDRDGKPLGAEALLRWRHPERGLISPGLFIPIAEDTRLILPIGQWVLEEACRLLARWQDHPATAGLTLAVNVSAIQFRDNAFVANVARALADSGAPPALLKLEITESLLLNSIDKAVTSMRMLKDELGVSLALDDFGTGYSSLSYLKQLPVEQVKLDRSFVRDIGHNPNDTAIADAVIALGRAFNMNVIAEGVENTHQRDTLLALGCHTFQGFLYSRPVDAEDFTNSLTAGR